MGTGGKRCLRAVLIWECSCEVSPGSVGRAATSILLTRYQRAAGSLATVSSEAEADRFVMKISRPEAGLEQ